MRGDRRWRRRVGWLAILALLLFVGLMMRTSGDAPPAQLLASPEPAFAETEVPFPSDTASDVVSYADHVVVVTAVSQVEATPSASPARGTEGGEPTIPRSITFRVDRTLWSRPDAPAPPRRLTALWWGWLVRDGTRVPFVVHGMPWIIVGAQYVMPIAQDRGTFAPIQPFAVFRITRGVVDLEEQDTRLARNLADLSVSAAKDVFTTASPDPLAVRFNHLPPRARLAAVLSTRPTPSAGGVASG